MAGYVAIVLHAHLPFVRHPELERSLEETWLFEAITECYLPLLQVFDGWRCDALRARVTVSLSPTLCSMLSDDLLRERYQKHLNSLIELASKEVLRTLFDKPFNALAEMYVMRLTAIRDAFDRRSGNLTGWFAELDQSGVIELMTCGATHAFLPLLERHPPSQRAQVLAARDGFQKLFGRNPRGFWLPECGYAPGVDGVLQEANIRWGILDAHGIWRAKPRPPCGVFAPVNTRAGIAMFGRDNESARQVWSSDEGYPGDPRYRDFHKDAGYELDLDYLAPHLPAAPVRSFTGIKYWRVTGPTDEKLPYDPSAASQATADHAEHFYKSRLAQVRELAPLLSQPPILLCPYDAELFGHWWYEGPEFLDRFVRRVAGGDGELRLISPTDYLDAHPWQHVVEPSRSSWGEAGYSKVWLNERNEWVFRELGPAQEKMTELARRFADAHGINARALRQAARELMLAQSSDWQFILRTGTSPQYARRRVEDHLGYFNRLSRQIAIGRIDREALAERESKNNLFPEIDWRYFA